MKLSDLEAVGAYASTGFVDIYHEGRHKRLGTIVEDELLLTAEGEEFVAAMAATKKAPRAKKSEPPVDATLDAPPVPPGVEDDLTAALGDALGALGA